MLCMLCMLCMYVCCVMLCYVMYVCIYVCIPMYIYIRTYIRKYVRTYVRTYVCMYVCVYVSEEGICGVIGKSCNGQLWYVDVLVFFFIVCMGAISNFTNGSNTNNDDHLCMFGYLL